MVKKKLVALGVSVAAVTAVVGAGFAGWTFTSEAKGAQNLGVNITAAYSFGTLTLNKEADTVVLDQGTIASTTDGVTLAKSGALDTAVANITATWTVNNVSYADATAEDKTITYTVNVYVKDGLGTYVNCGATAASTDSATAKSGYTHYVFTPTTSVDTTDTTNTVVTITFANPLAFVDGKKPTKIEEYQAMVTAITGESTVTTDTAYDVAATDAPVIIEFVVAKTTA